MLGLSLNSIPPERNTTVSKHSKNTMTYSRGQRRDPLVGSLSAAFRGTAQSRPLTTDGTRHKLVPTMFVRPITTCACMPEP